MKTWRIYYTANVDGKLIEVETRIKAKSCEEAFEIAHKIDPRFGIGHYVEVGPSY